MTLDEELKSCFLNLKTGARQAQIRWCEAQIIDKEKKEMQALGISDALEYYGVKLGMNGHTVYPKPGSRCLIAILEGVETDAILLYAEDIELLEMNAKDIVFNSGNHGGMVKVAKLTNQINKIEDDINKLKQALSAWIPIPSDGGGALKSALAGYTASKLTTTKQEDLENKNIKQ